MSAATTTLDRNEIDEDLVVEDAVEHGPHAAEDGVEGRDDRDRQVGLQPQRHGRVQEESGDHADDEAEGGDHGELSVVSGAAVGPPVGLGVPVADGTGRGQARRQATTRRAR